MVPRVKGCIRFSLHLRIRCKKIRLLFNYSFIIPSPPAPANQNIRPLGLKGQLLEGQNQAIRGSRLIIIFDGCFVLLNII